MAGARLLRNQPTTLAASSWSSGQSVETANWKANIFPISDRVHWSVFRVGKPIASKTTTAVIATRISTNQIECCLSTGQTHWLRITAGTNSTNQNRCTETSALVGGSHWWVAVSHRHHIVRDMPAWAREAAAALQILAPPKQTQMPADVAQRFWLGVDRRVNCSWSTVFGLGLPV